MQSSKDSVWKEAIEAYSPDFLEFFFSDIARDIDFEKGYESLDKELQKIVQGAELGKRLADVLIKAHLMDGTEKWLLIHIEVQGYYEKDFSKRMFVYNYRIFDSYDRDVVSLVILADSSYSFRPSRYKVKYWGFKLEFEFPYGKFIDYKKDWNKLKSSKNPFAVIVMTHLKEMKTKKDIEGRCQRIWG